MIKIKKNLKYKVRKNNSQMTEIENLEKIINDIKSTYESMIN